MALRLHRLKSPTTVMAKRPINQLAFQSPKSTHSRQSCLQFPTMRIRKRPPPQIPSDPNAPELEERSIPVRSAQLHLHGDLLKGLHGWRRRPDPPSQDRRPLDSHHQVLQEEKKEAMEVDSREAWNSLCSDAKGPYEDMGDDKPILKVKGTNSTFNDRNVNRLEGSAGKKWQSPTMEGSRCSRVNGRGWRCGQETMVGYSLCEHHLGKGRLRSIRNMQSGKDQPETIEGRRKIGMLKARSISSLISECNTNSGAADQDSDVVRVANRAGCDIDDFNDGATQIMTSIV